MQFFAEHAPKSTKYQFTKFGPLTARDPKEDAIIILKLLFLTRQQLLTKNQRALSNRENGQK